MSAQDKVTELVTLINGLNTQLADAKKELSALLGEAKNQLRAANALVGNKNTSNGGAKVGRPRGSVPAEGELSVSQQVLNFVASQEGGAQRAEILAAIPNRDSAVQAAIRVHQQKGKIVNKDHRWHYVPSAEAESTELECTEPEITVTVTGTEVPTV